MRVEAPSQRRRAPRTAGAAFAIVAALFSPGRANARPAAAQVESLPRTHDGDAGAANRPQSVITPIHLSLTGHSSPSARAEGTRQSLPAEGTRQSLPAEGTRRSLPAEGTRRSLPAEGTRRSLPAEGTRRSLPAEGTRRSLPAEGTRRSLPAVVTSRTVRRTIAMPNMGARLSALRRATPHGAFDVLALGLTDEAIAASGAQVQGRVGPVVSLRASVAALARLQPRADWIDAPQPLRPALDTARRSVAADAADEGQDFSTAYRGRGVIIAAYDTGVDLRHPDLRQLDGATRVRALWDQDGDALPPPPTADFGSSCRVALLLEDACPATDPLGHGTTVLAAAASSGPRYRGIAPEADLVMVQSSTFGALLPAMAFADDAAAALGRPMVFNISLTGQEGPHDGTSLEAQAINGYGHLVVVAAGNEGALAVHASTVSADAADVWLRFPPLLAPADRRAVVDVWGEPGSRALDASVILLDDVGTLVATTATIGIGDDGRTDALEAMDESIGTVDLDAGVFAGNDRPHIRIALTLDDWEDAPAGAFRIAVRVRHEGLVHLWVDTPATEPAIVVFDEQRRVETQVLGDTESTISDPSTAVAAIAVAAYTTKTEVETTDGVLLSVAGEVGALAAFTSRGPTLSPQETGAKPELSAPGNLIVAARSRDALPTSGAISDLYRAAAGTSFSAPLVAGAAAVILSAAPELSPANVKQLLLETAGRPGDADPRWGAGRLDVTQAVGAAVGFDNGCICVRSRGQAPVSVWALLLLAALSVVMTKARVLPLGRACLGRHQA